MGDEIHAAVGVTKRKIRIMIDFNDKEITDMYAKAVELATVLTKDGNNLFKTTFQCIFWEACHYLFQLKLRESKK